MTMKKRALLSIHPEFAEAILNGEKRYEFRRVMFRRPVDEVVVYATSPVARVLGSFRVAEIYDDAPAALWERTSRFGGVTREKFDSYFANRERGYAIKIEKPTRFAVSQPLSRYVESNTAPQSFCYV